jgi:hypothetical protein
MDYHISDRERVRHVAKAALARQIGILDAARALTSLLHKCPQMTSQEDLNFIIGVDSETDDLPLGRVRELWNAEVLAEKDRGIQRCEQLWGDRFRAVCERILLRSQAVP